MKVRDKLLLSLIVVGSIIVTYVTTFAFAANCDSSDCTNPEECQRKIEECQQVISLYSPAQNKNKEQLAGLDRQLSNTEKLIKSAEVQLKKLESSLFDRGVDLEYQKEIFGARVRNYYIRSRWFSPLLLFLSSDNAAQLTRELSYRNSATNEDKKIIQEISGEIKSLEDDKKKLENNKSFLAKAKATLSQQADFLRKEVSKVDEYLGALSSRVASLSAKQEALLSEKADTFQTSVGEVPLADDPASRPDYNPGFSPAFAVFSFGAPHRKGMSQYGAYGRSKGGQSYEQILKAYFGDVRVEKRDLPSTISTTVGSLDFENNYLRGISEMPSSWADNGGYEALKAQAIAARSYAMKAGKPICTTEACQVYSASKAANPPDAWRRAVEDTRGIVVVSNQTNDIISTWYASTSGGYTYSYNASGHNTPGLWDTSCGNQSCWTGEAWEKKAGSPWFYKAWYKSRSSQTCGRSHPWLTQDEMADILNAVIVYRSGQGTERILPVDYNSCFGGSGNPFSIDQMRQEAQSRGGAITSVGGVSATYATNGNTAKVVFGTNRGDFEVSGDEFYTVFNLRAPGRTAVKSKLFNLEKK